jgi:hypothetical protein
VEKEGKKGSVLVSVDGSEISKSAVEFSIILSERYKPERLIFLHVLHPKNRYSKSRSFN